VRNYTRNDRGGGRRLSSQNNLYLTGGLLKEKRGGCYDEERRGSDSLKLGGLGKREFVSAGLGAGFNGGIDVGGSRHKPSEL